MLWCSWGPFAGPSVCIAILGIETRVPKSQRNSDATLAFGPLKKESPIGGTFGFRYVEIQDLAGLTHHRINLERVLPHSSVTAPETQCISLRPSDQHRRTPSRILLNTCCPHQEFDSRNTQEPMCIEYTVGSRCSVTSPVDW